MAATSTVLIVDDYPDALDVWEVYLRASGFEVLTAADGSQALLAAATHLPDIVVMDLGGTRTASAWGGLASRLAQRRGVRGTIMWGTCRDVEEIRMVGYPVWAVGVCPRRSRNEFTFGSINEKIEIGGVSISPGDYIVADESGVVCVPRQQAEQVLDLLIKIEAQERALEEQVTDDAVSSWDDV